MKTEALNFLTEKIREAKTIAITGHKNPDGDSLCSVLALFQLIKLNFNKNALCLYDGNIPDMLDNVPLREKMQYFGKVDLSKKFDLVFVLDYGTRNHIGGVLPVVDNAKFIVEIDHHKPECKIGNLSFSDGNAFAVGDIIFNMTKKQKWKKDQLVNDLFAISILTDTGFFKYARKGSILRNMAALVDDGVDIERISNLLNNKPKKDILTEAAVASRAEFFYNNRLALATIDSKDYKNIDGRGETILSLLTQIKGVEFVVLLKRQKENQTGVSLRSKSQPIDAIAIALGGGGHKCAAGAVVQDSLDNVRSKVLELFRGVK